MILKGYKKLYHILIVAIIFSQTVFLNPLIQIFSQSVFSNIQHLWLSYPTKLCIKSVLYLHQKSAIWALNVVLFMKLWWFLQNSLQITLLVSRFFLNDDVKSAPYIMQIDPKYHQKSAFSHHYRILVKIRHQKGEGTKMHKCLVG